MHRLNNPDTKILKSMVDRDESIRYPDHDSASSELLLTGNASPRIIIDYAYVGFNKNLNCYRFTVNGDGDGFSPDRILVGDVVSFDHLPRELLFPGVVVWDARPERT